ncbi:hypothetical protein NDU88_008442 [Pleurodeles waltl]|uniref:Uncharacterized protein n=1 Tax=Pleurodeles waltl TaxID=8319 RepID=A0AAV7P3M9_PLEWA|nr:hypothetical protein NDU88_008442 [Pleurodeles waltl]
MWESPGFKLLLQQVPVHMVKCSLEEFQRNSGGATLSTAPQQDTGHGRTQLRARVPAVLRVLMLAGARHSGSAAAHSAASGSVFQGNRTVELHHK